MEPIGCPETSVTKYQSTQRNIPEERRPHLCILRRKPEITHIQALRSFNRGFLSGLTACHGARKLDTDRNILHGDLSPVLAWSNWQLDSFRRRYDGNLIVNSQTGCSCFQYRNDVSWNRVNDYVERWAITSGYCAWLSVAIWVCHICRCTGPQVTTSG
jgi:hypothetical protein